MLIDDAVKFVKLLCLKTVSSLQIARSSHDQGDYPICRLLLQKAIAVPSLNPSRHLPSKS